MHLRLRLRACPALLLACGLAACALGAHAAPVEVRLRDERGQPLPNAAVYVLLRGQAQRATPGTRAELGQRDKQFSPRISLIQTGTAVEFPNFDTVRHHVYSFSPIRSFEIKLYVGTPAKPVVFDLPGTAVLGCNIHDHMAAWVHVVDTPVFALSDAQGRVQLEVPAGEHELRAWHAGLPEPGEPMRQRLVVTDAAQRLELRLAGVTGEP